MGRTAATTGHRPTPAWWPGRPRHPSCPAPAPRTTHPRSPRTVLEVLIAFFLPPVSVAMKKGLSSKVLIAVVLQLRGHIPGVIYGIYVVTQE